MDLFTKTKAVKLRSHLDKYLVADDDQEHTRQSRNGSSRQARWLVELVEGNDQVIRLKSCHGRYLTASDEPFLLGMTGNRVLQTVSETIKDVKIEWQPIRDGFQMKLKAFGGTYLRANGGTRPWKNSVTHDSPFTGSTRNWILWDVETIEISENENLSDYLSMVSSFSSISDELSGLDLGSPASVHSSPSPMISTNKSSLASRKSASAAAMDLFHNAKAVRLRSVHNKYLAAEGDEESVTQDRDGSSKNAKWTVEFVENAENIIRLKSCYDKYLTASNQPFLLGMTGRKVTQSVPRRLDSSLEWEPIRDGHGVKLRTRYGQFLRANGGLPPWRNSVTHDIPHRTATQNWILWDVHVVEIAVQSPGVDKQLSSPANLVPHSDSFASEVSSPSTSSSKSPSFSRQQSSDSFVGSPPKVGEGRAIYFHVADEFGEYDEAEEELGITFKGNNVEELTKRLEEVIGLENVVVCTKSPLNGKLYPLRLQLPPNNATMHVVLVPSSTNGANEFSKTGTSL